MKYLTILCIWGIVTTGLDSPNFTVNAAEPGSPRPHLAPKRMIDHRGSQTSGTAVQLHSDGKLHLVWYEEQEDQKDVKYLSTDINSENFPSPVTINPSEHPAASLHEPPAIALGSEKGVYIAWNTPHPKANGKLFTSLLLLSRSEDEGRTFLPPLQVNDDQAVTGHSFDYLAVSPDGSVHISWLDARDGKKDPATYTARLLRQERGVTTNLKLDDDACVCCRTHVTTAHDGTVYIAWRKVFFDGVRETVIARSTDHGRSFSPPVIVGHDRWVFEGCPHRPATIGTDREGRLYVTWYTEGPDDTPGVYFAYSDDQGKTFTPRRQLNTSKGTFPDHPQLAVNQKGHLLVVWEEQSPVRREVVFSYSSDRGITFSPPTKLNEKKAKSPAVALNNQGQGVIVWMEQVAFPGWSTMVQPLSLPSPQTGSLSPSS